MNCFCLGADFNSSVFDIYKHVPATELNSNKFVTSFFGNTLEKKIVSHIIFNIIRHINKHYNY